jgi:endonuclease I
MNDTYKELRDSDVIFPQTIDEDTAYMWDEMFPKTNWEETKTNIIDTIQSDERV